MPRDQSTRGLALAAAIVAFGLTGQTVAQAAQYDECIRVAGYVWGGQRQSMDPADMRISDDAYHIYAVYNRLLDVDSDFRLKPELAESWSVSDDGKTWTFNLRQGVKFHDGSDFDAGDVVYTFRRLLDPKLGSGALSILSFLDPEGIQVVDPHTVRFVTDEPVAELPLLITNKYTNIVPEGATHTELRLHGNGTGPFMQEVFEPNGPVRILRRNPNYWQRGLPKAECLKVTVIQEPTTAMAAFKSGDIDLLLNVNYPNVRQMKAEPNAVLKITKAARALNFAMWIDVEPFDDVRVRKALKLVVDRQAIVDTVLLGYGETGGDTIIPLSAAYAYTDQAPARDVEHAKELLAEAGYPDGLDVELYAGEGTPGLTLMAQAYAQMAADAGINVKVTKLPADSYWDEMLKVPFKASSWGVRSTGVALKEAYSCNTSWDETHWCRPAFDKLLKQATRTIDESERVALYRQAQKIVADEGAVIVPVFMYRIVALRKGCSGFTPHIQNFNLNFERLHCE